jgi:hypothetical protein
MTDERPSSITVLDLLQSSNPSKAARGIKQLSCASLDPSVLMEVRRVWRMRESSTGEPTMNDPLVRALLAKCIVETPENNAEVDPDRLSAAQVLRHEISNADPQIAINALLGIPRVATRDDVQTILNLGLHRKLLVSAAVTSLSLICLPEARGAIQALKSAYAEPDRRKVSRRCLIARHGALGRTQDQHSAARIPRKGIGNRLERLIRVTFMLSPNTIAGIDGRRCRVDLGNFYTRLGLLSQNRALIVA